MIRAAADHALAACTNFAPDCTLYAVDNKLAHKIGAGSR
jgi:hypothetical protein